MRSHKLLGVFLGILPLLFSACDSDRDGAAQPKVASPAVTIDQLCNHFVQISTASEDDQVAKRDRKTDYKECMSKFPAMESQLAGAEKKNFRTCAMVAQDLAGFTGCAPSLFQAAKAPTPTPPPPPPPKVG